MHFRLAGAVAFIALAGQPTQATPVNYVSDGSFENGLAGWAQSGSTTYQRNPIVAIQYGAGQPFPNGAYREAIPADGATSASPDPVGSRAAYFSDDIAVNQSLSQTISLAPGQYRIGFDAYAPANGYRNTGDARLKLTLGPALTVENFVVSSLPKQTWVDMSALETISQAGSFDLSFLFNADLRYSKDVIIDRVYVISVQAAAIGEPLSIALVGSALLGLTILRRRRL